MALETVHGEPGWQVKAGSVEAFVTRSGAQVAPVRVSLGDRWIDPFSVAPWAGSRDVASPLLRALRGDFFCMPFGGGHGPYMGEDHPLHGEPANLDWTLESEGDGRLELLLDCQARPCRVHRSVRLGERAVYHRATVTGLRGPMTFGTHAMVKFGSRGRVSTSPISFGQVFPGEFERPAEGGYSSLEPGAGFSDLSRVRLANGGICDLTAYPAREGFEDLVMVSASGADSPAWSAVTFPEEGWAMIQLKDPRVLPSTVLWFSNGGRHYPPWSGRHRAVLGIEEVCSYFHLGLRGSLAPNAAQVAGVATFRDFDDGRPFSVSWIQAFLAVPDGFDRVERVVPDGTGVAVFGAGGRRVHAPVDLAWL